MPIRIRPRWPAAALLLITLTAAPSLMAQQRTLGRLDDAVSELSKQVAPAVVQILISGYRVVPGAGSAVLVPQRGSGSGMLVDPQHYGITNYHVIENGETIEIAMAGAVVEEGRSIVRPPARMLPVEQRRLQYVVRG